MSNVTGIPLETTPSLDGIDAVLEAAGFVSGGLRGEGSVYVDAEVTRLLPPSFRYRLPEKHAEVLSRLDLSGELQLHPHADGEVLIATGQYAEWIPRVTGVAPSGLGGEERHPAWRGPALVAVLNRLCERGDTDV